MKNRDKKTHIVAITAIVRYGNKFLILKRNPNEIAYPGKWTIPGGKVEKGEQAMDVLKREVKEETGLDIEEKIKFLRDYTFTRPDGYNVIGFTFLVSAINDNVKIDNDFEDFKWVLPEELERYDCIEGIKEDAQKAFPRYNKLVRDRIPEIIKENKQTPITHIANDEEYWDKLKEKLKEEVDEFLKENTEEELADILEIVYAIRDQMKIDKEKLEQTREQKAQKRGAFKNKIILDETK